VERPIHAACRQVLLALIAAISVVLAAVVPSAIGALDDEPLSCSERIVRLDALSPELKEIYARPGDPPEGA
jgi:hypothetical protein